MLNAKREQKDDTLIIRLEGQVIEGVNLPAIVGDMAPDTVLNCKGVVRLNSVGVKAWIRFFQDACEKGTRLRLQECSPAVVEQINLILNFVCCGVVESIYVPFACVDCEKSLIGLFQVSDLKRAKGKLPTVKCSHCSGKAVFDDIPGEYFRFMERV